MDPITCVFTIIGATCAVITAIDGVRKLRQDYRAKRDGITVLETESSREDFIEAAKALSHTVNDVSSTLGRNLPFELDAQLQADIRALQPRIKSLLKSIESQKSLSSAQNGGDGKFAEIPISPLEDQAMELRKKLQKAIDDFRSRLRKRKVNKKVVAPAPSGTKFCYGAILCQNGKATAASLAVSTTDIFEKPEWGFICQYCNLEVGDYKTILLSSAGTALETSDLLASCHVMACDGQNLRAYYKCLVCYLDRTDNAFSTASALETHMMEHPVLPLVLERPISASARAAQRDIEKFLEHEIPKTALPDNDANDSTSLPLNPEKNASSGMANDDGVSPADSPTGSPLKSHAPSITDSNGIWAAPFERPLRPPPPIPHTRSSASTPQTSSTRNVHELDTASPGKAAELDDSPGHHDPRIELPAPEVFHSGRSDASLTGASRSQSTAPTTPFPVSQASTSKSERASSESSREPVSSSLQHEQPMVPENPVRPQKQGFRESMHNILNPRKREPVSATPSSGSLSILDENPHQK
ncbi:hypothetical protein FALBO_16101 [Fusarium albosuccineum]|uniref:Uncharacterized protein n=1 Tax=Fusarium albosuccineum TaxID=1237068 RepID=A0A8H4P1S7_9HYPO|nr:hypothetical protein FALBO_16101 [Fusarium albosuccineum]